MHYRMSFDAFNKLVEELSQFLKSYCFNPMRSQLEIKKIVIVVLYKFVHGFSLKHMSDRFDINAPIIHKYVDIVCDVLCDKGKLFDKYIHTFCRVNTRDHSSILGAYRFVKHMWCH
jgi:hypothetical protein